jgi:hypothetical protein
MNATFKVSNNKKMAEADAQDSGIEQNNTSVDHLRNTSYVHPSRVRFHQPNFSIFSNNDRP